MLWVITCFAHNSEYFKSSTSGLCLRSSGRSNASIQILHLTWIRWLKDRVPINQIHSWSDGPYISPCSLSWRFSSGCIGTRYPELIKRLLILLEDSSGQTRLTPVENHLTRTTNMKWSGEMSLEFLPYPSQSNVIADYDLLKAGSRILQNREEATIG